MFYNKFSYDLAFHILQWFIDQVIFYKCICHLPIIPLMIGFCNMYLITSV
jgi:hypothetical protein